MSKLQEVRDLLSPPPSWIQGEYNDDPTEPTCFCLIGALNHVHDNNDGVVDSNFWYDAHALASLTGITYRREHFVTDVIIEWNDNPERTHTDVLNLLDTAIAASDA